MVAISVTGNRCFAVFVYSISCKQRTCEYGETDAAILETVAENSVGDCGVDVVLRIHYIWTTSRWTGQFVCNSCALVCIGGGNSGNRVSISSHRPSREIVVLSSWVVGKLSCVFHVVALCESIYSKKIRAIQSCPMAWRFHPVCQSFLALVRAEREWLFLVHTGGLRDGRSRLCIVMEHICKTFR